MRDQETRLRNQSAQLERFSIDRSHLIVQDVDLTFAIKFSQNRFSDHAVIALHHVGADRQALLGRRGDGRHVADAGHGLMQ